MNISRKKTTSIYDIPYFKMGNNKVFKTYNWKPRRKIYQIIEDTFNWMRKDYSNIARYFK